MLFERRHCSSSKRRPESRLEADRTRSVDQLNGDFAIPWFGSISLSCGAGGRGNKWIGRMMTHHSSYSLDEADVFVVLWPAWEVRGSAPGGWQDWHILWTLSEAARTELSTPCTLQHDPNYIQLQDWTSPLPPSWQCPWRMMLITSACHVSLTDGRESRELQLAC